MGSSVKGALGRKGWEMNSTEQLVSVKLFEHELMRLDGNVNNDAQSVIDKLKSRNEVAATFSVNDKDAMFIVDVVSAVSRTKLLSRRQCAVANCRVCGKKAAPVYYKSGRNKGDIKGYLNLRGFDLAESFIRVEGHPSLGACSECVDRLMPLIMEAVSGIEFENRVPGYKVGFIRNKNRVCLKCGWKGHDGEMKKQRTVMGDGWYPAGCPACTARNGLGFTEVEIVDGYTMTPWEGKEAE